MWAGLERLIGGDTTTAANLWSPAAPAPSKRERLAAAARSVPCAFVDHPSVLRVRLYGRVFWISPRQIAGKPAAAGSWEEVRRTEIALLRRMQARTVVSGDWDLAIRPFRMSPVVEELFVRRIPREETTTFRKMVRAVEAGDLLRSRQCRSVADVHARFDRIEAVYHAIAHHGFRSQRELGHPPEDDVTVCIGRTGAILLLRYGNHRTSMALAAGAPRIAVRVIGVHADWVRARQAEYDDGNVVRVTERGLARLLSADGRPAPCADAAPEARATPLA